METDERKLEEIYRLERENNRMLHSMRRQAFWGGLFKVALYLLALGIPIWLYFNYLAPVIKTLDQTLSTATGRQVRLEGQFQGWADMWKGMQEYFGSTSSSTKR